MKTDCMPFTAIPHNSRLFLDFLFHFDKVQEFYAHRPHSPAVLEYARKLYPSTPTTGAPGTPLEATPDADHVSKDDAKDDANPVKPDRVSNHAP